MSCRTLHHPSPSPADNTPPVLHKPLQSARQRPNKSPPSRPASVPPPAHDRQPSLPAPQEPPALHAFVADKPFLPVSSQPSPPGRQSTQPASPSPATAHASSLPTRVSCSSIRLNPSYLLGEMHGISPGLCRLLRDYPT